MIQRKEITKEKWKLMIYGILIVGTIIMSLGYTFFSKGIELTQEKYLWFGLLFSGIMLLGIGAGLAQSRTYRIKGYDDLKGGNE